MEHTIETINYNEVSFADRQHITKTQHESPLLAFSKVK